MANLNMMEDDEDATSGAGVGLLRDHHDPDIEGLNSLYLSPDSTTVAESTMSHGMAMTMTTITETNAPTYTAINTDNHDEAAAEISTDEADLELPPLSSYLDGWRFWWRFAQVPILFVMINAIVMVSLEDKQKRFGGPRLRRQNNNYEMDDSYANNNSDPTVDPTFARMRYNSIVLAILFLVDTAVLFRVALFMEKSVQALRRRQESNTAVEAPYSLTHVHAKASKMLDDFLSRGRSKLPEVSVFINILYLMTALCFVATAVSLTLYCFLHTSQGDSVCNSYHETTTEVDLNIQGVPDELQFWASFYEDGQMFDGTYVHMVNGITYFAASNQTQDKLNPNSEDMSYGYGTQVLFSARVDGTLQSYPQIKTPAQFTVMAGPSEQASEGFCCLYRNNTSIQKDQGLLCIFVDDDDNASPTLTSASGSSSTSTSSMGQLPKEMKIVSLPVQEEGNGGRDKIFQKSLSEMYIRAYDGRLYLRLRWYTYNTRTGIGESEQVEIYSLTPQTFPLNWTFVGSVTS
jgi:hypothetical protein